jgi:hypothetical protein
MLRNIQPDPLDATSQKLSITTVNNVSYSIPDPSASLRVLIGDQPKDTRHVWAMNIVEGEGQRLYLSGSSS